MAETTLSFPVSLADQIRCVEREIGMRKKVYPRWVESKKMSQAKADAEVAAMEAVLVTLKALPPLQGSLM